MKNRKTGHDQKNEVAFINLWVHLATNYWLQVLQVGGVYDGRNDESPQQRRLRQPVELIMNATNANSTKIRVFFIIYLSVKKVTYFPSTLLWVIQGTHEVPQFALLTIRLDPNEWDCKR
ncbi:MAG: hypothetical protein R3B84_05895 [Zavarzinella sp.]